MTMIVLASPDGLVASIPGNNFEIDTDANLMTDGARTGIAIDWNSVSKQRKWITDPVIGHDDSLRISKEDEAILEIDSGSIPPNKSDPTNFGVTFTIKNAGVVECSAANDTTGMAFLCNPLFKAYHVEESIPQEYVVGTNPKTITVDTNSTWNGSNKKMVSFVKLIKLFINH